MKKWLLVLTVLLALCLWAAASAESESAFYTSGDNVYTVQENGTAVIVDYMGQDAKLLVPSHLDGYPVTEIVMEAFLSATP